MDGCAYLDKLYCKLQYDDVVMHTTSISDDKYAKIDKYMQRLDRVHKRVVGSSYMKFLKNLYYDKYVVKYEDIPDSYDKDSIISGQKSSLECWIDYLTSLDVPMWIKYWIFQGVVRIGSFDYLSSCYMKRSKTTLKPFIYFDEKAVSNCIWAVKAFVSDNSIMLKEVEQLISSGNFSKLYHFFLKCEKENSTLKLSDEDGIWIKYSYESISEADEKIAKEIEPEYMRLYNSIKDYDTPWCTASFRHFARDQICGCSEYFGGDFYVYYTKDENSEYKIPRIAIRMDGTLKIGEIRGVADVQNVEDSLIDVLWDKLKSMEFLDDNDVISNFDIICNLKKLNVVLEKIRNNCKLDKEDVLFIYQVYEDIRDFGKEPNPLIRKIILSRNILEDYMTLDNDSDRIKFISRIVRYHIQRDRFVIGDRDIILRCILNNPSCFMYAEDSLYYDYDFVLEALNRNIYVYVSLDMMFKVDMNIVLFVLGKNSDIFSFLPDDVKKKFLKSNKGYSLIKKI